MSPSDLPKDQYTVDRLVFNNKSSFSGKLYLIPEGKDRFFSLGDTHPNEPVNMKLDQVGINNGDQFHVEVIPTKGPGARDRTILTYVQNIGREAVYIIDGDTTVPGIRWVDCRPTAPRVKVTNATSFEVVLLAVADTVGFLGIVRAGESKIFPVKDAVNVKNGDKFKLNVLSNEVGKGDDATVFVHDESSDNEAHFSIGGTAKSPTIKLAPSGISTAN